MVRRHSLSFIGHRDVTRPRSTDMETETSGKCIGFIVNILTRGLRSGVLTELTLPLGTGRFPGKCGLNMVMKIIDKIYPEIIDKILINPVRIPRCYPMVECLWILEN